MGSKIMARRDRYSQYSGISYHDDLFRGHKGEYGDPSTQFHASARTKCGLFASDDHEL